jgi:hypothetical protein
MRRTAWSRFIGLCTMVFTAHLSLVGTDLVCASHAGSHSAMTHGMHGTSGTSSMSAASMGAMDSGGTQETETAGQPAMASASTRAATDHAPCQIPPTDHYCDAMTGCVPTLAVTYVAGARYVLGTDDGVPIADTLAPLSRLTAPEPPPPKA